MEAGKKSLAEQVKALKAAGRDDVNLKITWAKEAIAGLQCVHEEHHVWTDIKAENYVNFYNEHLDMSEIKCIDFDCVVPQGDLDPRLPIWRKGHHHSQPFAVHRERPRWLYRQDNAARTSLCLKGRQAR